MLAVGLWMVPFIHGCWPSRLSERRHRAKTNVLLRFLLAVRNTITKKQTGEAQVRKVRQRVPLKPLEAELAVKLCVSSSRSGT